VHIRRVRSCVFKASGQIKSSRQKRADAKVGKMFCYFVDFSVTPHDSFFSQSRFNVSLYVRLSPMAASQILDETKVSSFWTLLALMGTSTSVQIREANLKQINNITKNLIKRYFLTTFYPTRKISMNGLTFYGDERVQFKEKPFKRPFFMNENQVQTGCSKGCGRQQKIVLMQPTSTVDL
jgi:hypothetical protein